ncbi:hypothetical protein ES703_114776 [subsurface metagenome]
MTLAVSIRVPDGVVLAVDSLTTVRGTMQIEANIETTCKHCGKKLSIPNFKLPPVNFPSSTSMFAQKLFPLKSVFSVGSFGSATINKRSIYSQIKRFERHLQDEITSVDEIAQRLEDYFMQELEQEGIMGYLRLYCQWGPRGSS